mmetsp:Transcript_36434/g.71547  ORF Transcript_36434/g.71547 Transcript_36434/m.71547 type:complete len:438 (+) Transcript_36434:38-1351(+)
MSEPDDGIAEEVQSRLSNLLAEHDKKQTELFDMTQDMEAVRAETSDLQTRKGALQEEVSDLQQKKRDHELEVKKLELRQNKLEPSHREYIGLVERINKVTTEISSLDNQQDDLQRQVASLRNQKDNLEKNQDTLQKEKKGLEAQIKTSTSQRDELKSEVADLERQVKISKDALADQIEERKKYGSDQGVIGLQVAQLGKYGLIKNEVIKKRIWVMGATGAGKTTLCRSIQAMEFKEGDAGIEAQTLRTDSNVVTYLESGKISVVEIFDTRGLGDHQRYGVIQFFMENFKMIRPEDYVVVVHRERTQAITVDLIHALNDACAHYTVIANQYSADANKTARHEIVKKFRDTLEFQSEVELIGPTSFSQMTGADDFPKLLQKILDGPSSQFHLPVTSIVGHGCSNYRRWLRYYHWLGVLCGLISFLFYYFLQQFRDTKST